MIVTKKDIENRVLQILEKAGFENFLYDGCFDVLAKNDRFLAIKTLKNIDALTKENATNLKIFSHFFSASALMISIKSNHAKLEKNIIYSRFDIPTLTPELFQVFIENEWIPSIFSIKGKHTVMIKSELLRKERMKRGLSLESLGNEIGISKKSLYEIENERVKPTLETVEKLERFFNINLIESHDIGPTKISEELRPKTSLQKKVSIKFDEFKIEHSCITTTPFEIIGKKKKTLSTSLTEDDVNLELRTRKLSQLLSFTDTLGFFILKKMEHQNINGIPILLDSEIDELEKYRDFYKLIRERAP